MKNKLVKSVSILMLFALVAAYMPSPFAYADRDGKKGERYEHYKKDHDENEREEEEHEKREYSREKVNREQPAAPVNTPPVQTAPAAASQAQTGFADKDQVTFAFPSGTASVQGVVRLQQGVLYVPLSTILEATGTTFTRYPKGHIWEGFANGKQFIFQAGKPVFYLNGQKKNIGGTAFAESNQLYVPLQAAADALGFTAVPNPQSKTIQFK